MARRFRGAMSVCDAAVEVSTGMCAGEVHRRCVQAVMPLDFYRGSSSGMPTMLPDISLRGAASYACRTRGSPAGADDGRVAAARDAICWREDSRCAGARVPARHGFCHTFAADACYKSGPLDAKF